MALGIVAFVRHGQPDLRCPSAPSHVLYVMSFVRASLPQEEHVGVTSFCFLANSLSSPFPPQFRQRHNRVLCSSLLKQIHLENIDCSYVNFTVCLNLKQLRVRSCDWFESNFNYRSSQMRLVKKICTVIILLCPPRGLKFGILKPRMHSRLVGLFLNLPFQRGFITVK